MAEDTYKMGIGLSVVPYIGPDLYSNVPAVISELIANAWDSSATLVKIGISLKTDTITIEDNGNGMSLSDLNNKYLRIGYKKRSEKSSTFNVNGKERHVMGRKGIGKLAPFALAEELEIQSSNGQDEKVGCIIRWAEFKKAIDEDKTVFTPTPLVKSKITVKKGTKLTLKLIRDDKKEGLNDILMLRKRIARRFTVSYPGFDFDVKIEGESITDKDRPYLDKMEFVWCTENAQQDILKRCPNLERDPIVVNKKITIEGKELEIKGWLGTVLEPKHSHDDHNDTISIFAHGKLVQEDILPDMAERQMYASYIIGDIQADFLDINEKDDIVTPDRQRLNHNDPRYIELKKFIKHEIMSHVGTNWGFWRNEKYVPKHAHIQTWYHKLKTKSAKKEAAQIYKKIAELNNFFDVEKDVFNEVVFSHFAELKNLPSLTNLSENEFAKILQQYVPASPPPPAPELDTAEVAKNNETEEERFEQQVGADTAAALNPEIKQPTETNPEADFATGERPEGVKPENPRSPKYQAEFHITEIAKIIKQLPIEQDYINVALFDLKNALLANNNTAYKACIVMLGAVLEGVMLATLRRNDVILKLNQMQMPQFPQSVLNTGILSQSINPSEIADKISASTNIGFEEYRKVIKLLIPGVEDQLLTNIQQFRNSIHPYKVIKSPEIFAEPDSARAIMYIASLEIIVKKIANWNP
jgi:hypothetical protein